MNKRNKTFRGATVEQGKCQRKTGLHIAISALFTFGASTLVQASSLLVYDGTTDPSKAQLEQASSLSFPVWVADPGKKGLIYRDSDNGDSTVNTGADLKVDYPLGTAPDFVVGGYSNDGSEVKQNTVRLIQGTVLGPVYGGVSHKTVLGFRYSTPSMLPVYGSAKLDNASTIATGNDVHIETENAISGNIYGGNATVWVQASEAESEDKQSGNTTQLLTNTADAGANLGSSTLTASSNIVSVVNEGKVDGALYGGYAYLIAEASEVTAGRAVHINTFSVSGVTNSATTTATAGANVGSSTLTASSNIVSVVNEGKVDGALYGGYAYLIAKAGEAKTKEAATITTPDSINNTATATTTADAGANVGSSTLTASSNIVSVVNEGKVDGALYGGYAYLIAKAGKANPGTATVTATATTATATATATAIATATATAIVNDSTVTANNNKITVGRATTVMGSLYGGYAGLSVTAGTAVGGATIMNGVTSQGDANATLNVFNTKVLANGNSVTFDGNLQNGSIYGAYAKFALTKGSASGGQTDDTIKSEGSRVEATNNTVTIGENAQFSGATSSFYGGYMEYLGDRKPASYDVFTGNTLNFFATQAASLQTVANFENLNFHINPAYANTDTVLITAQDVVLGMDTNNSSTGATISSKVAVVGIHSGPVLQANDKFLLMKATNSMTDSGTGGKQTSVAQQGISLLYEVETEVDLANKVVAAKILSNSSGGEGSGGTGTDYKRVNPELKALSEGYLSGALLVSRGADAMAYDAFNSINAQNKARGFAPFAQLAGGQTHYNSGSFIKSQDFLLSGGLSYQENHFTVGGLVEVGGGNYDTYNKVNETNIHGAGKNRYYGLGVLGRYHFSPGFYADTSLRFGRNHNQFASNDIINAGSGERANYTLHSNYIGAHLGAGYILSVSDQNQLDFSAKYLWTRLAGKDANVTGDPIQFDRINLHRVRLNGELHHQYDASLSFHGGLAYEYGFGGKADATSYGLSIDAPSVKGSTAILSLGLRIKPSAYRKLFLDIKADGYKGKREGANISLKMNYVF